MSSTASDVASTYGWAALAAYWITQPVLNRTTYLSYQVVSLISSVVGVIAFTIAVHMAAPDVDGKTILEGAGICLGVLLFIDFSICISYGTCGVSTKRMVEQKQLGDQVIHQLDHINKMLEEKLKR